MKKILIGTGIFLIIIFTAGYFYLDYINKSSLPKYNEKIAIPGLSAKVEVFRDEHGVPHVYAQNEKDLYIVTGYLQAQDRMWQMDLLRRVTQGRLAEIFGKELVEIDVLLRKLRIPGNSRKIWNELPDSIKNPVKWYAQGVNFYLENQGGKLPVEFKILGYQPDPWKPEHSLNLVGYMAWNLELGYKMEVMLNVLKNKLPEDKWQDLFPDVNAQKEFIFNEIPNLQIRDIDTALVATLDQMHAFLPQIFNGSNNWAISGKKTASGKPLFSNDMHLHIDLPSIWSRMHQTVPGKLDVTGVVLPGEPFVVAGHNERIAWGMTNVMLDGADFYVETLKPGDPSLYRFNGQWRKMEVRHEKIQVKGEKNPVERTLYFTHRGPVFTSVDGQKTPVLSMRWIGNEKTYEIKALYLLNRAKNWQDFREAVKGFKSVSQNIAYADTDGNIGLQNTGRIPKRSAPGYLFLPGDTDKYDWKGFVPFDSLPYEFNPARGFVSSANNRTVDPAKFPYYISEWFDLPYRIKRIRQMLNQKNRFTAEDVRQMLYDHYSLQAEAFTPKILQALSGQKLSKQEQQALETLKNWDFSYEINSKGPAVFEATLLRLIHNLVEDELGKELTEKYLKGLLFSKYLLDKAFRRGDTPWADDIATHGHRETFNEMIVKSFKEAVAWLEKDYGSAEIEWGKLHRYAPKHPLGKVKLLDKIFKLNRSYPAPGNANTVNPFTYEGDHPFNSNFGASEKHIFDTGDWDQSKSILPSGVSGQPESPYYADQMETYVNGLVFPDYFSKQSVREHQRFHAVYTPVNH